MAYSVEEVELRPHFGEILPPPFTPFENIFKTVEGAIPEPKLDIGLGYKGPSKAYDVKPVLSVSFKGSIVDALVYTRPRLSERDRILKLAIESVNNMSPGYEEIMQKVAPETLLVRAGDAPAGPQWRLLFDRETVIDAFQKQLQLDDKNTGWSLGINPPTQTTPPRESLKVSFPDSELAQKLHLLVPEVKYEATGERSSVQNRSAMNYHKQLRSFTRAAIEEFRPYFNYWFRLQQEKFSKKTAIIKLLEERHLRISQILGLVLQPPM